MKFINALVVKLVDTKDLNYFPLVTERYLNVVKKRYKDSGLNIMFLNKGLKP